MRRSRALAQPAPFCIPPSLIGHVVSNKCVDYSRLLQRFIQGHLPADKFQLQYLNMLKQERRCLSEPLFEVLERLFGDVDAFNGDSSARKALDATHPGFYLDEKELRRRVVQAAEALRALERNALPAGHPDNPVRNDMEEQSEFRARILDVLQLIADSECQLEYQRRAPHVDVASELFNQWDDAYHPREAEFRGQFEKEELLALEGFADLIDLVAAETPQQLPPLAEFINTPPWRRLSAGARLARSALHGITTRP